MTESLPGVVTPYARFLECQDRRRRKIAEAVEHDRPATVDPPVEPAVAVAVPATPEGQQCAAALIPATPHLWSSQ
jgi:hypothetical protein